MTVNAQKTYRIFVSSPGDVDQERMRVERVVQRLNLEFVQTIRFEAIRWETRFYRADSGFQQQIAKSAECDIVIGILWSRLGSPLPADFDLDEDGLRWPSGTAYEIMTAIASRRKGSPLPDVYIFRKTAGVTLPSNNPAEEADILDQRSRLQNFWQQHFHTLEGEFKAAFQSFDTSDAFEDKLEALLRHWVADRGIASRGIRWPVAVKGSPFRGLETFDSSHSPVFFGRDSEVGRGIGLLQTAAGRGYPALFIVGASGAGKSSLVRAGIVPRLRTPGVIAGIDEFRAAVMLPKSAGSASENLAQCLFQEGALPELVLGPFNTPARLALLLDHADATAVAPIVASLDAAAAKARQAHARDTTPRIQLILVIDQLEGILLGEAEKQQAFAGLVALLCATGRIWIVSTLRADFYEKLLAVPALAQLKQAGATMDLAPPGVAELKAIVREPADAAGLVYEKDASTGKTLDDRILADAAPDTLPLLQFTLQHLFEEGQRESIGPIAMSHAAYDRLGGIDGAIGTEAEKAIAKVGEPERMALPRLLRQLASVEVGHRAGDETVVSRPVPLSVAASSLASAALVKVLVAGRILVSDGHQDKSTVRLAHERILSTWSRAANILAENREFLRRRSDAEIQFRRWQNAKRANDLLIPAGISLAEATTLLDHRDELSLDLISYIRKSVRRDKVKIQRNIALAMAAVCAFGTVGTIGFQRFDEASSYQKALEREASRKDLRGKLTAYSTSPGATAYDGTGRNSNFTNALIEKLKDPYLSILQVLVGTIDKTVQASQGMQRPSLSVDLNGDLYIHHRPPWRQIYVISIGINAYKNLPDLQNAENDASDVADVFRKLGYPVNFLANPTGDEIRSLLSYIKNNGIPLSSMQSSGIAGCTQSNEDCTAGISLREPQRESARHAGIPETSDMPEAASLRRGLSRPDEPPSNTVIFLYYSGHGINVGEVNYLIGSDAEVPSSSEEVSKKFISINEVYDALSSKAAVVVTILDAARNTPFKLKDTR